MLGDVRSFRAYLHTSNWYVRAHDSNNNNIILGSNIWARQWQWLQQVVDGRIDMDLNYSLLSSKGESMVPSNIAKQEWLVDGKCTGMTTKEMSWRKFGNFSQGTSHTFDCLFGACLWHFFHKFFIGGCLNFEELHVYVLFHHDQVFFCIGNLLLSKFVF